MQKAITGSAIALTIGLALTGCSAATAPNGSASFHVSPTHSTKPLTDLADLKAGEAVDDSTASAINAKGGDTHAYKLPNGTYVIIKRDEPLPPAVQADVTNIAKAAPNDTVVTDTQPNVATAHQLQGDIGLSTGKNVAVIQYGSVTPADPQAPQFVGYIGIASFYDGSNPAPSSTSEATVQADLQAEINKQPDPASWIIVVNN